MPVPHEYGYSREAFAANVSHLMTVEHLPQDQALARAYDIARRAWRSKHPRGPYPHHLRGLRKPPDHRRGKHAKPHHENRLSPEQVKAAVHEETHFAKEIRQVRIYPDTREVKIEWVTKHGIDKTTRGKVDASGHMEPFLQKLWARAFVDGAPLYECG